MTIAVHAGFQRVGYDLRMSTSAMPSRVQCAARGQARLRQRCGFGPRVRGIRMLSALTGSTPAGFIPLHSWFEQ